MQIITLFYCIHFLGPSELQLSSLTLFIFKPASGHLPTILTSLPHIAESKQNNAVQHNSLKTTPGDVMILLGEEGRGTGEMSVFATISAVQVYKHIIPSS